MQIGILIFSAMVTLAIGGRVPDGFLPLPPLPVMYQVPTQPKTPTPVQPQTPTAQQKHTPKTKVPPKTTAAPITKKPTTGIHILIYLFSWYVFKSGKSRVKEMTQFSSFYLYILKNMTTSYRKIFAIDVYIFTSS